MKAEENPEMLVLTGIVVEMIKSSPDAVVEVKQEEVGVEVDGPFHFIDKRPTGSTMLKRRQVSVLDGIEIVSVPYWEWDEMKRNRGMKQQYLRTLLGLEQCDE